MRMMEIETTGSSPLRHQKQGFREAAKGTWKVVYMLREN